MSVVVVGSLSMDLTAQTERMPRPGETVMGHGFLMVPGGKGNNQAVTCARLGAQVKMLGCVGQDSFGEAVVRTAAAEGVDTSGIVPLANCQTGIAHITVDAAGCNAITVIPAANSYLSADMVYSARGQFAEAAVVLVQMEIPLPTVHAALEVGRSVGATTILNPAPAAHLSPETLRLVDIFVPNEIEAAFFAGHDLDGDDGLHEAASALMRAGPRRVVITRGEKGAFYRDGTGARTVPPLEVEVVDTVAAGDAFCGGLATALARGEPIEVALRFASAAGAVAVTRAGATPSLPYAADVERLLGPVPQVGAKRQP